MLLYLVVSAAIIGNLFTMPIRSFFDWAEADAQDGWRVTLHVERDVCDSAAAGIISMQTIMGRNFIEEAISLSRK
jgi:hypothetical protein